jgi:hypothetical protein
MADTKPSTEHAHDLPAALAAPARRALASAGYPSLAQLSTASEAELLRLHGMGPQAIGQLRKALAAQGLAFARGGPVNPAGGASPVPAQSSADVAAFITRLEHPRKAEIEAVRALILSADPRIHECIKWNAPSFALADHFATFKLRPETTIQVVLHTGAKVKANPTAIKVDDPTGLLTWAAPDRARVTFVDLAAIQTNQDVLVALVRQWIAQL